MRLQPKPIRPTAVRIGDLIIAEEIQGDIVISRRGRVAKVIRNGPTEIASTAGGRVLYVWDWIDKWTGTLYIVEASTIDTLTELEFPHE